MIPERADVVIIGGGIIGCSIAYHLTKIGITDVVLLERRQLCCGTTWHSVGSVAEFRGNRPMTELASYSAELYRSLEAETGQATGYRRTGSIMFALNRERLLEMKRAVALARALGQEAEILSTAELRDRCPVARTDDVLAGFYLPSDGRTNPVDTTQALAKGARMRGAKILENVLVEGLAVEEDRVIGVTTEKGAIRAEAVVLAAGMWSRSFAARYGVSLPLQAAEHFYAVTEPIDGLAWDVPFVRVPDESTYYKEESGKLLFGCLEKKAKPWALDGIPADFCFDALPEDLSHFEPILLAAVERFPLLENAGIKIFFNGPESFTPDGDALLGETPELRNLFVACGMNTVGVMSAGGVGRFLAKWIHDRERPAGFDGYDVRRMSAFRSGHSYLRDRTVEAVGVLYDLGFPNREYLSARGARRSPLHERLLRANAVMGDRSGWEVPLVFARPGEAPEIRLSYDRQNWVPWAAAECRAASEGVALFDLSAAAKVEVEGRHAAALLDRLSATAADTDGLTRGALWLTRAGTIEASVTVMPLADERFLVLSAPGTERRILDWVKKHTAEGDGLRMRDATSAHAALLVVGPRAADLLARVGAATAGSNPVSRTEIGYAPVAMVRMAAYGPEAWLVLLASEFASHALETLETAHDGPIVFAGAYALDALRIENDRPAWPQEMDDTVTPLDLGLGDEIAWSKPDFIGKDALFAARDGGIRRRGLVKLALLKDRLALYGQEAILLNGRPIGLTTSGAWCHAFGAPGALGFVKNESGVSADWLCSGDLAVDVSGEIVSARAFLLGSQAR